MFTMLDNELANVIGTKLLLISTISALPDDENSLSVIGNFYEQEFSCTYKSDRKWQSIDSARKEWWLRLRIVISKDR